MEQLRWANEWQQSQNREAEKKTPRDAELTKTRKQMAICTVRSSGVCARVCSE